jgi:curved DNA-binding protein CbpA
MNTLYDVLGVSRQTNAGQIEQAYRSVMETLTGTGEDAERDMIRAKAIKEAHAILSSPSRRQAYDEKLKLKEQVTYQIVEKPGTPWVSLALIGLVLAALVGYYKYHTHQVEVERIALEAARAKSDAETATRLAEVEDSRLAQQLLIESARADAVRRRETELARGDGQRIHYEVQRAEAQAAREKEYAARQLKTERQQEEQAAQARVRNQTAAMQRALAIPIVRH